jgi:hypothetical protein
VNVQRARSSETSVNCQAALLRMPERNESFELADGFAVLKYELKARRRRLCR